MSFNFEQLDADTRRLMLEEVDRAHQTGNIYSSKRFNAAGMTHWVPLQREAAGNHNEHWLAYQVEAQGLMKEYEEARKKLGGYTVKHVPHTAAETLAEGQFNRFYILAIARRALDQGQKTVRVYRAKERADPRPESEALIGSQLSVDELIQELRSVERSLKHPLLRPNSGLSVRQ